MKWSHGRWCGAVLVAVLVFLGALAPLAGRVPPQIVSVHSELRPAVLSTLHVLLYQFGSDTNDVLALPVLDHVQGLEGADDVLVSDAGQVAAGEESGWGVRQYSMCCSYIYVHLPPELWPPGDSQPFMYITCTCTFECMHSTKPTPPKKKSS